MGEDSDDDFLDRVIEFGDGRQYQVQPVDAPQSGHDSSTAANATPEVSSNLPQLPLAAAQVTKEDRFADDFDRSWPRSASLSSNIRPRAGQPGGASTSSTASLSPQEASRVLFNERSNRLEPWSHRPGPPDGRPGRDAPPHHNVQLLQKQGFDRPREVRRDTVSSQGIDDRHWDRGRRASNATTTHSVLSGGRDSSRESLRQLPPHLSPNPQSLPPLHTHQLPFAHRPPSQQGSGREGWRHGRSPEQSPVIPSPSDAGSHAMSPSVASVLATSPQVSNVPLADIELARKAAMHSAAERAKLRRQQEEEEREKERERARRKAAELEEKMKPAEQEKAKETPADKAPPRAAASPRIPTVPVPERPPRFRTPSLRTVPQDTEGDAPASMTRTRSQRGSQSANQPPSVSAVAASWRSKAAPLPPVAPRRLSSSQMPAAPLAPLPSASQILDAEMLPPSNGESLEEVEFMDLGKFVGAELEPHDPLVAVVPPHEAAQSEASTDERSAPPRPKSDLESSWRRKGPLAPVEEQSLLNADVVPGASSESPPSREADATSASPSVRTASTSASSPIKPPAEASSGQTLVVPLSLSSQKSPRAPSYREGLRSTFEDTMSRIKGAMQAKPQPSTEPDHYVERSGHNPPHVIDASRNGKGSSPATRTHLPRVPDPDEPYATATELADDVEANQRHRVRLPPTSRVAEPLSKKEQASLRKSLPPLGWEVLSWDPPVEGMSARDFSVNDVLFRKPPPLKGKPRFIVTLPPPGRYLVRPDVQATPKVHLPAKPLVNKTLATTSGAFGRPRAVDDQSAWRSTHPSIPDEEKSSTSDQGLVTRSGSSPPGTDKPNDVASNAEAETQSSAQGSARSRTEPKMPTGAGVAFYRESNSSPSVKFTVSSELEEGRRAQLPTISLTTEEPAPASSSADAPASAEVNGPSAPPIRRGEVESKSSDGSSDAPLTPPSSAGWSKGFGVKDSPVRQPDPEKLKLLWSQTSEKAGVPGVNSLEGIADDLPSVPFSLQEVKSEDGGTPPPAVSSGPGPSRMSLHDVTRAFQQVPPPPAGSTVRKASPQPPPMQPSNSASARHPTFLPHAQPMHPAYSPYPSPMLSHSPAPTMMYPHPMPSPMMGGHSQQYPQPMWIPIPGPPPGGQTPGAVMRPLPSPYPTHAQYMPYPSPGAYAPSPTGPPGPPPNGAQGRPRPSAPAGMSPSLSHARPPVPGMYQGSPVLVHPQVMHVQPAYPGAMPAGRGVPMQGPHPTPASHAGGYAPAAHASYVRQPW
ncbi:hypothetical protein BC834DRAFT_450205 [Gloeopeniophorella convolvens]|nr:hypothetical protein BC834DRAFT_450205 [Gloeopeniophorella convolvens]